jgi:transposase
MKEPNRSVTIGLDAAVVADHQVAIRGDGIRENFRVAPTLAGMRNLTERLSPYAGALVVAEPTGGTWLPLSYAISDAGCELGLVQNRDSARLREAISGRNKTDMIDAEMLAASESVLGVTASVLPSSGQLPIRRALRRRYHATVDAHRAENRLWGVTAWLMPDVWRACGGHRLAQPLLARWPHLGSLSRAHLSSLTEMAAAHTRDREPSRRAQRIADAATGWYRFWEGRLDLDAMAWEITELSDTISTADAAITRAAKQATGLWRRYWPDDLLLTVPGIGPITAAATRGWWGDGTQLMTAKAAASFVGLNPSNRESGLTASPSRPITKEGPPELRLAYYQAANIARRHDPQLAVFYQRLMVERGHNHIQATCAVARKLACRAWAICQTGRPY